MKIEDYEQYWQKGGTYILPIEVFNEVFGELENWKQENQQLKGVIDKAIEYINNHIYQETFTGYMDSYELKKLLKILKGEENE